MKKIFLYSTLFLISVSLINEILNLNLNPWIKITFALAMILSGLTFTKPFTRTLSIIVLGVSAFLGIFYKLDFIQIIKGVESNIPIGVLFLTVPFISIPIRRGGYLDAINLYFKKFSDSPNKFFSIVTFIIFSVGSVTNLASVRIVNDVLSDSKLPGKFLVKSYGAGFSGCMAWSPYFAGVTLSITYAGISFSEFFPFGLLFSFLVMGMGLLTFSFDSKTKVELIERLKNLEIAENIDEKKANKKIKILAANFITLLLIVIIGEKIFEFSNIMYLVSIVSIIYGLIWLYLVSPPTVFIGDVLSHRFKIIQTVSEVVFFLAVGILAKAIALTPVKEVIKEVLLRTKDFHPFLMIELLILAIVVFAILGVHQIVSMTIIGTTLPPEMLGISPVGYSIMFAASWMLSALSSPFVPFNMVLSEVVKKSTFVVAFKYNIIFNITILLLSGAYILLLLQFT